MSENTPYEVKRLIKQVEKGKTYEGAISFRKDGEDDEIAFNFTLRYDVNVELSEAVKFDLELLRKTFIIEIAVNENEEIGLSDIDYVWFYNLLAKPVIMSEVYLDCISGKESDGYVRDTHIFELSPAFEKFLQKYS